MKSEKRIPRHPGLYWRGPRIWMRYCAGGRVIRESTGSDSIAEAVAILEERKTLARQGKFPILRQGSRIKFEVYKDKYIDRKTTERPRSRAFIRHVALKLNEYFGKFSLDQITETVVRDYTQHQRSRHAFNGEKPIAAATVNRRIAILRNMLNCAVKDHFLLKNPVDDWLGFFGEEHERQRLFSRQELDSMLALSTYPLREAIIMAINTGCRLREIIELPWHEVDLDRRVITLNADRTKGKRTRAIAMTDVVFRLMSERQLQRDALRKRREEEGIPFHEEIEYVFPNPETGKPYASIQHQWKKLLEKCGIKSKPGEPAPRFHDIRHTAATNMAMAGAPQAVIRDILGHKYSRTTDRYMGSTDAARKRALEAIQHDVPAGEIVKLSRVVK